MKQSDMNAEEAKDIIISAMNSGMNDTLLEIEIYCVLKEMAKQAWNDAEYGEGRNESFGDYWMDAKGVDKYVEILESYVKEVTKSAFKAGRAHKATDGMPGVKMSPNFDEWFSEYKHQKP